MHEAQNAILNWYSFYQTGVPCNKCQPLNLKSFQYQMLNIFSDINASAPKSMLLITFKFIFFHQNKPSIFKGNYCQLQNRTFLRYSIQGVLGVPQSGNKKAKSKGSALFQGECVQCKP